LVATTEDHRISDEQRTMIEHLPRERIFLRGICRMVGVRLTWLLHWLTGTVWSLARSMGQHEEAEALDSGQSGKLAMMQWQNEPPLWRFQDDTLHVTTGTKTDFWRKTHYGFVRDNGHCYYQQTAGNLIAEVKVSGKYEALYDQAGLMLRVDEANWIKCGIEFVDGVQQASVVVTRDYSDWSVVPLPQNPTSVWLRVTRRAEAVAVHYSLDGEQYTMLRLAYLVSVAAIQVGLMCASPEGEGFPVTFEGFSLQSL
jgi:uncharacterized protein